MTAHRDNNLRIAITGSLVLHALLFLILAWMFAGEAARRLWQQATAVPKEQEVVLLFPEQIVPEPPPLPPPSKKSEIYIRTAQNERADTAPKNAPFIADRNTKAASVKAPFPDGTEPLPTTDGIKIPMRELADRDFRNGELKDDARPKTPEATPAMLQPRPPTPPQQPAIVKPKDAAPPPQPVTPPQNVAKAVPESTPLTKMMEEADKALASVDKNRLSIEVRKPEAASDSPPMPQKPEPPTSPARDTAQTMPESPPPQPVPKAMPIPKALPVADDEPVTRSTLNPDPNAFTPFTRTSQTKGTISNRGTENAVDAEDSPKGRYIRQVTGQVEKKWHIYRTLRRDGVTYGSLKITFYVNKKGKVEDLRVVNDKESNPVLTGFTLQAIRDAEIPPIPADVLPSLPMNDQERLKIEYNVLIY
ncbi:MAG: hypothetical protein ACKVY0_01600 [Prosthecobacter sp.]|uniref:hypothetical protein n=1 Tax=Prosthecobacter sp. TaxID=1965333 RepID=UPI0038FEEACB